MPVLNLHNFALFYFSLCCCGGGFNFKKTGIPILYVELRCERAFLESYMAVSFIDVQRNLLVSRWNSKDSFMLFQME